MAKKICEKKPLIWLLQGKHVGDNLQLHALAKALGYPCCTIKLDFNAAYRIPNFLLGGSLKTLHSSSKSLIRAPWPDLVICAGRRSVPVARWIKARTRGECRLVQLGRPRAALSAFDLVVTTPQYDLPDRENVVQNLMPMSAAAVQMEEVEREEWLECFSHLPRPWTGVLVGGSTWPFDLSASAATDLGAAISLHAANENGGLVLTSGPRTSGLAVEALQGAIHAPAHIHKFGGKGKNPYSAMLALCDAFIVTGDSVSMISEACKTGKPVFIFDVPRAKGIISVMARGMEKARQRAGLFSIVLKGLAHSGVLSPPRNVARFHAKIIKAGYAARLNAQNSKAGKPLRDELASTVRRIKLLFIPKS